MTDNSQNKSQSFFRHFSLPGQMRTARNSQSAASFSRTASAPADPLPSTVSQKQRKNLQHFCIDLPDAPFFVQRDTPYASNLQHLADDLAEKRLQILSGMIGCGKSALARQYAFQHFQGQQGELHKKLYASVFWLDATQGPLEETLERIFKVPMELQPGQSWLKEFTEKIRAYEADLTENEHWLLVVDGCDEPHHYQDYLNLPGHLLKHTQRGHIILTTRRVPDNAQYTSHVLREIENMTQEVDKARELLLSAYFNKPVADVRAEDPRSTLLQNEAEMQAATELVAELWYNPLLICEAGKYMYEERKTPSYLLPLLPKEIMQDPSGAKKNKDQFSQTFTTNLIKTLRDDHEFIHKDFPASYEILMLCAFLNRERIPRRLIDFRPEIDSISPVYKSHATQPDGHIQPLRTVGFLKHDEDSTFFHLNLIIRNMVHRRFQPRDTDNLARSKAFDNELRQYQVYTIHTVSTVFLDLKDVSTEYISYAPHIMKSIKYLEEKTIQEYIRENRPFMLDTVFRFLSTVGHYLRQHPQSEGVYSILEIADAGEKTIEMNRAHLFKLALQIYHLWTFIEQDQLERKQILYKMLPTLHEHFLYEQNRSELKKIEGYYPALQDLVTGDDESIRVHYDLGCLKSDLNDFEGAKSQFENLDKELKASLDTANELQKLSIDLWRAEIQISKAANWIRQALYDQDKSQVWTPYTHAKTAYTSIDELLLKLEGNRNNSEEIQRRADFVKERSKIGNAILKLITSIPDDKLYPMPTIEEVETYRDFLEQKISTIVPSREISYLTYLQMVVDLSNLAEAYRRLGKQKEQKGISPRKIPFFETSKDYSLCALTCYDYFYQIYPEMHLQVQVILQTAWANYKLNPLYKENEKKTPTRLLLELQESYRKNDLNVP